MPTTRACGATGGAQRPAQRGPRCSQWDQQTMMPRDGGAARAEALATLDRIAHELFISDETGQPARRRRRRAQRRRPDSTTRALVRVARRDWEKARRVPTELAAELARAASLGQEAWVEARADDRLRGVRALPRAQPRAGARATSTASTSFECAYDALLDDYDPQMTTAEVASAVRRAARRAGAADRDAVEQRPRSTTRPLHGEFPIDRQRQLVAESVELMGFDRAGLADGRRRAPVRDRLRPRRCPDHDALGRDATSPPGCTARCTSAVTACTRRGSPTRCSARRSATARRSACTSPRAGCGRTWSAAAGRSAGVLAPRIGALFGTDGSSPTLCTAPSTASSRRSSASRPTRRPTACTSCCASSSSRS